MDAPFSGICAKSKTLANGESPLSLRIVKNDPRTIKIQGGDRHEILELRHPSPQTRLSESVTSSANPIKTGSRIPWENLPSEIHEEAFTPQTTMGPNTRHASKHKPSKRSIQ